MDYIGLNSKYFIHNDRYGIICGRRIQTCLLTCLSRVYVLGLPPALPLSISPFTCIKICLFSVYHSIIRLVVVKYLILRQGEVRALAVRSDKNVQIARLYRYNSCAAAYSRRHQQKKRKHENTYIHTCTTFLCSAAGYGQHLLPGTCSPGTNDFIW